MSGIKISIQEINRVKREQLALKAQRKAREEARKREQSICMECGQDALRAYIEELKSVIADMKQFTVKDRERQQLTEQLEKLMVQARGVLDYVIFDDDEKAMEEYIGNIRQCNTKLRDELKRSYKAVSRWEHKQEKADKKEARILEIQKQEQKKLEQKQEMLQIEEQNNCRNVLEEYEREYIHESIEEAMEEIGCELLGIKESETVAKQEEVFSYQEGVAIHVIEQNCQITMEVVATDTVCREPSEAERELVQTKMFEFEEQYTRIQEILNRKGISPKSGSEMILPPSKAMVRIENICQYDTNQVTGEEALKEDKVLNGTAKKRKKKSNSKEQKIIG